MNDIVTRSTVSLSVTPKLNGNEITDLEGGVLQFKFTSVNGEHSVMKESTDGDFHFTPEEMDLPVGKYKWSCRWKVDGDIHFLGQGYVDIVKNDFTEEEDANG